MNTLEKNKTSPLYILCKLMPQIIPLFTFELVHIQYEKFIPWEAHWQDVCQQLCYREANSYMM